MNRRIALIGSASALVVVAAVAFGIWYFQQEAAREHRVVETRGRLGTSH